MTFEDWIASASLPEAAEVVPESAAGLFGDDELKAAAHLITSSLLPAGPGDSLAAVDPQHPLPHAPEPPSLLFPPAGKFSCSYCGKHFSRMGNKLRHERIHRNERPHRCHFCGKSFLEKSGKKIHERIHTGERPYSCAFCGKTFTQQCHKVLHERTHMPERPMHVCDVCGRVFAHKKSFALHERTHHKGGVTTE